MIQALGLTRRFGELAAVDRLDLEIVAGEIFGLVGPDGAGKTTTLRLLAGLLEPSEGRAIVAGYDVARRPSEVKDNIGYMAQRFGLYGDLTVRENMLFYAELFGMSKAEREALMPRLLRMTRMEPFRQRPAAQLSGGMKQKLALMCTLLHHPKVLLLDEPTNGVDPVSRRDFWAILYQLVKDGLTVLVTTAYLDEAERCNRVGLMNRGRLIRCDSPQQLKEGTREACYEVACGEAGLARSALRGAPGVLSVEPSGGTLHLFLDESRNRVESLERTLAENGIAEAVFRRLAPSLEDVFIAEIARTTAEA
jgi:ABC-2 type transport system ATP-binding protein